MPVSMAQRSVGQSGLRAAGPWRFIRQRCQRITSKLLFSAVRRSMSADIKSTCTTGRSRVSYYGDSKSRSRSYVTHIIPGISRTGRAIHMHFHTAFPPCPAHDDIHSEPSSVFLRHSRRSIYQLADEIVHVYDWLLRRSATVFQYCQLPTLT